MTDTTMLAQAVEAAIDAQMDHRWTNWRTWPANEIAYERGRMEQPYRTGFDAALPLLLAAVVKECTRLDLEWVGPDYQQTREMAPNADGDYVEVGELQSAATRLLAQQQQQGKKEGEG